MKTLLKYSKRSNSCSYILVLVIFIFVIQLWFQLRMRSLYDDMRAMWSVAALTYFTAHQDNGTKFALLWSINNAIINKNNIIPDFKDLKCPVNNCMISKYKKLLNGDVGRYDAIIFSESDLLSNHTPKIRLESQLYVYNTIESAYYNPVCELRHDNFFNWTFTYRLDSTIVWNFFIVRNLSGAMIAPSADAKWEVSSDPISPEIKAILGQKKKAAAWLVSDCDAASLRDDYLTKLQEHLFHFSLKIDVFGACTKQRCVKNDCNEMFKKDYFFYMAFENSFSEDYVTEKVLHGYENYAVPVVYGGANYSRFLPPGSYINARETHPYNLAFAIKEAVEKPDVLEKYFRWRNLYTVQSGLQKYHPMCKLCAALHDNSAKKAPAIEKFRLWWNGVDGIKWCLSEAYWNETLQLSVNPYHILH